MNTRMESLVPDETLRRRVIEEYQALAESKLARATPTPPPLLVNISGLPAAGKSTLAARLLENNPSLLYLSFD